MIATFRPKLLPKRNYKVVTLSIAKNSLCGDLETRTKILSCRGSARVSQIYVHTKYRYDVEADFDLIKNVSELNCVLVPAKC